MSIDESCEKIIRQVCKSKLDFHMNQTPYSLYFSIRKKFVKGHVPSTSTENPQICETKSQEPDVFNIWHEYNKLYYIYQDSASVIARLNDEIANKCNIEETFGELKEMNHRLDLENKSLKNERSEMKVKYDKKCKEVKVLNDEINLVKKDKNSTSVALTRCKKEQIETNKSHEKKLHNYEKKLNELVEYRNKKLSEERDIKIKQRKELKKTKKHQSEEMNKIVVKDDSESEERDFNLNIPVHNLFDSLRSCISLDAPSSIAIEEDSLSLNPSVPNSSDPVPDPHTLSLSTTIATASSTYSTTNMFTESLMAKPNTTEVSGTTDDTFSETNTAAILAALKSFSNSMDKCIAEIRR